MENHHVQTTTENYIININLPHMIEELNLVKQNSRNHLNSSNCTRGEVVKFHQMGAFKVDNTNFQNGYPHKQKKSLIKSSLKMETEEH